MNMADGYRVPPDDRPRCRAHPRAPATETCARCGAPTCDVCASFTPSGVACAQCEPALRRRRRKITVAVFAGIAALCATGLLLPRPFHSEPAGPPPHDEIAEAEGEVINGNCNDRAIVTIERDLLASDDRAGAVARAEGYERLCPTRGLLYGIAMDRGDAALAVDEATRLIDADPTRAPAWAARARAHVLAGHEELAALDYRQALTLQRGAEEYSDEATNVPGTLGRGCAAALVIADLLRMNYWPIPKRAPFSQRARRLWASPTCAEYGGSGSASWVVPDGGPSRPMAIAIGDARRDQGKFVF